MRQVLFEVPVLGLKIYGFGLMVVLGLYGALWLSTWRARREKLDPEIFLDLSFGMILGGVLGARLFFVVQHRETIRQFWDVFKVWEGGIVLYGSGLGAAAGFFLYRWRRPFPVLPALDVIAPSIALGIALGRVGCFLNGCCHGDPCGLPWAVEFPAQTSPWTAQVARGLIPPSSPHSLPVHPTQLYSALDGLVILALLSSYYPLRRRDGEVMALLLVTYPITRFLIEQLRDDEGVFFAGLTISQNISILVFLGGLVFWYSLFFLPTGRYADSAGQPTARQSTAAIHS